jgi:hypothetical protein
MYCTIRMFLLFGIIFFIPTLSNAQRVSSKWLVMFSPSLEANDTRLFSFADKVDDPGLSGESESNVVVTHSLSISRKWISSSRFEAYAGLGYARKTNRFFRPYDYCFALEPGVICSHVLKYLEKYQIDLVQLPLIAKFYILDKLAVNTSIVPEFSFRKTADGRSAYTGLDFYTIEVNPGISYETDRLFIGLSSRIFQLKKIDRVLFPSFVYGPLMEEPYPEFLETYETYNPFKLSLMVGYKL